MTEILLDLIDALDSTYRHTLQRAESTSAIDTLTTSQLRYIDAVRALSNPTVTEVADALDVTPAAATVGLKKLVSMGYATKTRSEVDRRVLHVNLTKSGERLVEAKEAALSAYGESVQAALSPDEAAEFSRLLAKVTHHLRGEIHSAPGHAPDRPEARKHRTAT